jgi:hypothetical protein
MTASGVTHLFVIRERRITLLIVFQGFVIASEAKQSIAKKRLDCFVASLLAMTW